MRIMSVDLGDARTGLAVCDETEFLASPFGVIHESDRDILLDKLSAAVKESGARLIVMGYPKNMDGSEGERARIYADFADRLREKTGLEVVLRDERRTTVSAHNVLNATNTRGKKRKNVVDAVAAVIILQDYIDFRRNSRA